MYFILIFFVLPLIEISLFIKIGGALGLWQTLLICLLTAIIGGYLFRNQGISKLQGLQTSLDRGRMPVQEIFDGVCILIAGALLITPGFATDVIGFSLFVPAVRKFLAKQLARQKNMRFEYASSKNHGWRDTTNGFNDSPHVKEAIDVEAEHVDDDEASKP